MSAVLADSVPWHKGEQQMHRIMRVPEKENPSAPYLTPGAAFLLQTSPLLALGTVDELGRPWTTVWGGEPGFAGAVSQSIIGVRSLVDGKYDPVVETLLGNKEDGEVVHEEGDGRIMAALAVDLEKRKRVKLMGRMAAGSLGNIEANDVQESALNGRCQAQLVMKIEQSLGNCPKYLNKKQITPALPLPKLVSDSPQLPQGALDLLGKADTLILSTSHDKFSMDTNIRGGPRGFIRVVSNDAEGAVLAYPEYSGNRLYQTLGNLQITPLAGYAFPDFETGNVVYVTGRTEVLIGKDAAALLPHSNIAVKVTVTAARYVEKGLPFRGKPGDPSPYNPPVRYLTTERVMPSAQGSGRAFTTATLVRKDFINYDVNRFRFKISDPSVIPASWTPGQYAILSFRDELDMGYSHMRDDDPTSINDDYIRTFTVTSYPGLKLAKDEFEITVRKHGNVTNHLFRSSERSGLEVELQGFAGEFKFDSTQSDTHILPFIAGGIGITPLIAQLPGVDVSRVRLFWSVSARDIALVCDTFERYPELPRSTTLFITGGDSAAQSLSQEEREKLDLVSKSGAKVQHRRMQSTDLDIPDVHEWYLCTGAGLKAVVLNWLVGKKVVYEDFTY